MQTNKLYNYFDFRRFLYLLRFELVTNLKTALIILGSTTGITFIVNISSIAAAGRFPMHTIFYSVLVLMIGGLLYTSMSFKDANDPQKSLTYITMPCSNLEKVLSKLLLSSVGWVIASITFYFLSSVLAAGLTSLFFGKYHIPFNLFNEYLFLNIRVYLIIQSLFLFGSIYFKKMAAAKTILSSIGFVVFIGLVSGLLLIIVHIDIIIQRGFIYFIGFNNLSFKGTFFDIFYTNVPAFFFWYLFAPFFWILTYFRLKEKEV